MRELARYFRRSGYVRYQNAERLLREGYLRYKKGDELRLGARSAEELATIRRLLELAGFRPGRAFVKNGKPCQPVYGRDEVRRFLDLVQTLGNTEPGSGANAGQRDDVAAGIERSGRAPRHRSA